MTRMNVCLKSLMACVLLTAATVVAGTRIVAAQPKETPAPNAEETQRDVELPPATDRMDSAEKKPTEKESAAHDKLNSGKAEPSVRTGHPKDADAREQFLAIERIARLSAQEQAKQLPHLYRDLAPRYVIHGEVSIISSYRQNILDSKNMGFPDAGDTYSQQLDKAAGKKSPEEVADAIGSIMWLDVAANERVLWVFGRHAKAVDKLLEVDLDSGEKSSVKRAACAIRALKRTSFSEKLLQIYLADDETSDGVWGPLLSMNRPHLIEPLLLKVEKDPRLLIRCAGLFQGPLYHKPTNPMLLKLVSSADEEISYHAASALYECKDSKLAPLAAKFAKNPAPRFRVTAAHWASNMEADDFKSIRKELLPLLADRDEKVQSAARECFKQQKDSGAVFP